MLIWSEFKFDLNLSFNSARQKNAAQAMWWPKKRTYVTNSPTLHWHALKWWRSNCTGQQLACFRNLIESKSSLVESNVFNRNQTHQIRRLQGHLRATMVHQQHQLNQGRLLALHLPPFIHTTTRTAAAELFACIWLTKSLKLNEN